MTEIRVGIIGFGKIARDQHVPAIAGNDAFRLVAAATRGVSPDSGLPIFTDYREMLRQVPLDAVAICTPPFARYAIARDCIAAGVHLLLEKPPTSTLGEIADLDSAAAARGLTLFTTWHAQFNEAVGQAAKIVRAEGVESLAIEWLEDVEKWHPAQDWIWQAGGFGVFDPGINAFSIATTICPNPLLVEKAQLLPHASGQQPIAAMIALRSPGSAGPMTAHLDWRDKDQETWTVKINTRAGSSLSLSEGGKMLRVASGTELRGSGGEYPAIYARFAELIAKRERQVDTEPLRLVADSFLMADRVSSFT